MAVLRVLFRAEFRHRWRSWALLALLVALVSGLVLAGVAAGRRTASAFPRYEAAHGYDAFVYSEQAMPKLAALPDVAAVIPSPAPAGGTVPLWLFPSHRRKRLKHVPTRSGDLPQVVKLVAGRMPDQADPDQVLASYTLQRDNGVHVGTVMHLRLCSASQRAPALSNTTVTPAGPEVSLRVVGIEVAETGVPVDQHRRLRPVHHPGLRPALTRRRSSSTPTSSGSGTVRPTFRRFQSQARSLGALGLEELDTSAGTVTSSIHPQAVGWWILAGLAGLVGMIVVAQALARQATVESDTFAALSALGVSRRQLIMEGMARTLAVGVVGVIGGVALAYLLSPFTPVGEARLADPTPGFSFDALILLVGALAAIVVVLALGLWPAVRAARIRGRGVDGWRVRPGRWPSSPVPAPRLVP